MNFLNKLKNYALGSGVELAIAIIYMLVGYMLIRIIISLLKRSVNRAKIEKTIPNFIISILNIVLIIVLVVSVLKFLGISTESVVTIASVISLGISLILFNVKFNDFKKLKLTIVIGITEIKLFVKSIC